MSSFPGLPEIGDINVNEVLPTEDDHATLTNNMTILMMRIIQNHIATQLKWQKNQMW